MVLDTMAVMRFQDLIKTKNLDNFEDLKEILNYVEENRFSLYPSYSLISECEEERIRENAYLDAKDELEGDNLNTVTELKDEARDLADDVFSDLVDGLERQLRILKDRIDNL